MTYLWTDPGEGFASEFDFSIRGVLVTNVVEEQAPRPVVVIWIIEGRADGPRGGFNVVLELRSIEVLKTTGLDNLGRRSPDFSLHFSVYQLMIRDPEIPKSKVLEFLINFPLFVIIRSISVEELPVTLVG